MLTAAEVAARTGVPLGRVIAAADSGKLPPYTIENGMAQWDESAVRRWCNSREGAKPAVVDVAPPAPDKPPSYGRFRAEREAKAARRRE